MVYKSPFPSVPISRESLPEKLLRAIWNHGIARPTKPALISATDSTKYLTFHDLYTQVHSVRAFLRNRGFKQGDVACLVLANCVEWPVFHLGVQAAGGAISGASALFTDYELERQFLDSRCSVVFTDDLHLEKVIHAAKNCDRVKTIICLRTSTSSHPAHLPAHVIEWAEVVGHRPEFDLAKVDAEAMAVLPYSSGTTGSPKGVMLSHRNFGTMIEVVKDHFDREIIGVIGPANHSWYNESFILNLPFYHIFGFGMLNTSILIGTTGVVMDKFEPRLYLSTIEKYRPRLLFTVPPIIILLAKHPMVDEFDLSSLKFILSGAAPAGRDICEEFQARHKGAILCQAYGMTEVGMASHLPDLRVNEPFMSVGKACANLEQKIIDLSTGKEVPMGERGEVCVRSKTVMMGYLNRPEATAETVDKEGWLHTGDIGYIDSEGRTFIVDRLKELIKVKGLQVPPAELEDLLLSHPLVRDSAVIGIPDKRRGELVRAYVVRANETLTEDDVIKFVAHKVSEYKHITGGVKFVTEVPKSAAGKILRRQLRDEAAKELKSKL